MALQINITSVPVLDQSKAHDFYVNKLGFQVKHDIDMGNGNRWLTVVSTDKPDGCELLLEPAPLHHEPTKVYQKTIYDKGMPWTQFDVQDINESIKTLKEKGVQFQKEEPTDAGTCYIAVLDDTVGNWIMLIQYK